MRGMAATQIRAYDHQPVEGFHAAAETFNAQDDDFHDDPATCMVLWDGNTPAMYLHSIFSRCLKLPRHTRTKEWPLIYKGKEVATIPANVKAASDNDLFYLCARCTMPPSEHADVWGENVQEAALHLPPGSIHATSPPNLPADLTRALEPSDAFETAQVQRHHRREQYTKSYRRSGPEVTMAASTKCIRATVAKPSCRRRFSNQSSI